VKPTPKVEHPRLKSCIFGKFVEIML